MVVERQLKLFGIPYGHSFSEPFGEEQHNILYALGRPSHEICVFAIKIIVRDYSDDVIPELLI